jgi:opacity protein-like surface antigen
MQNQIKVALLVLSATVLVLVNIKTAEAIPAFSRQHKTECSTCHTIYPELNEYGEAFQKNSYVPLVKKSEAKAPAPAAGAQVSGEGDPELLAKLKTQAAAGQGEEPKAGEKGTKGNEGLWLAGIPDLLPVSFRATQNVVYNNDALDNHKFDFATRTFVLNGGGSFRDKFGFFAAYILNSHAQNIADVDKLHELFIQWRNVLDTPFNIKFGRFEPKLNLWKSNNKITTASTLAPLSYSVAGVFPARFTQTTSQDAIEANAILWNRVFVAGGIVDRDGQDRKEGYGHISLKLGGSDFHGNEPEMDLDSESIFDYLTVTFGGFGYAGRNSLDDTGIGSLNRFYRAGGDMDLQFKRLRVKVSGVHGWDENPDYSLVPVERDSIVVGSEAEYYLGSPVNAAVLFRYEYQDDGLGITRRYVPAVVYTPLQNVKLSLEYRYEDAPGRISRIALAGATYAF